MRDYLPYVGLVVMSVVINMYIRKSLKPYPDPQQSILQTDLLLTQPILSPYTFWVNIVGSTWRKRYSYPKPFKVSFNLYDEGIVAQVPGKIVQLSYNDIDYFRGRELLNDVILFTKLEDPIVIVVRVSKYGDVLKLLASKGIKQKK